MASLSKVTKKRVKATLELCPGETLTLFHNPAGYTPALEAAVREAEGSASLALIVAACLIEWDLTVDNEEDAALWGIEVGQVVPLGYENIIKLPTEFLLLIGGAIKREQQPDPNTTTPKPSGSFS